MVAAPDPLFRRSLDHDYSAAVTLGVGVAAALAWSALSSATYRRVVETRWSVHPLTTLGVDSLHQLVVNGLMTVFFFAIGLELAREVRAGTLARVAHSLPPVLGAVGGMAATALLALGVGTLTQSAALRRGWGVPMATDIAFALGAVALAGRRLPPTLRLFLLTLAVADDVLSVVVLAFTGSGPRLAGWTGVVVACVAIWVAARRLTGARWRLLGLVVLWLIFTIAHVEAPLAGVVAGVVAPLASSRDRSLEDRARRVSTALVLPLFALVSCGVVWSRLGAHASVTIALGTIAVRLAGKVLGIMGGVGLSAALGYPRHPSITIAMLAGASLLCATGFTVPLLFAARLFGSGGAAYDAFTVGLLGASVLSSVLGVTLLRRCRAIH